MSRLATFCAGLLLIGSLSGCCMHGGGGYPYGAGYGGGGCATGACGAAPGYPSAGLYGQAAPMTAYGAPIQSAYSPIYPQTAIAPIDTLSTF